MKFTATILAAAAAFVASANGEACNIADLSVKYGALVSLALPCTQKAGYDLLTAAVVPTAAQVATMCTCTDLIKAANGITLPDCSLPGGANIGAIFSAVNAGCSAKPSAAPSAAPSSAPSTAPSSAPSAGPSSAPSSAPSVVPAPTKPSC